MAIDTPNSCLQDALPPHLVVMSIHNTFVIELTGPNLYSSVASPGFHVLEVRPFVKYMIKIGNFYMSSYMFWILFKPNGSKRLKPNKNYEVWRTSMKKEVAEVPKLFIYTNFTRRFNILARFPWRCGGSVTSCTGNMVRGRLLSRAAKVGAGMERYIFPFDPDPQDFTWRECVPGLVYPTGGTN